MQFVGWLVSWLIVKHEPLAFESVFSSVTFPFHEVYCWKLDKCILKFCLVFYDLLSSVFTLKSLSC